MDVHRRLASVAPLDPSILTGCFADEPALPPSPACRPWPSAGLASSAQATGLALEPCAAPARGWLGWLQARWRRLPPANAA